jgi:hypothetical protein
MLVEWTGVVGHATGRRVNAVTGRMREALTTRAVNYRVTDVQVDDGQLQLDQYTMRGQFAVRFGDDRSEQDRSVVRQGHVRTAFNSPYWPFVLATTSVGQEGLDFHVYCHAVTHWNLPANPVDLEQREGRVHRYKGHAVRKNVASAHRAELAGPVTRGGRSSTPRRTLEHRAPATSCRTGSTPSRVAPASNGRCRPFRCRPTFDGSRSYTARSPLTAWCSASLGRRTSSRSSPICTEGARASERRAAHRPFTAADGYGDPCARAGDGASRRASPMVSRPRR